MSKRKRNLLIWLGLPIAIQAGTYVLLSSFLLPLTALSYTPEKTHLMPGARFSWVWLQVDQCQLTFPQKAILRCLLRARYSKVYTSEADIPESSFYRHDGKRGGYKDGFAYCFSTVSRGPFWVRVEHSDLEGDLAASSGQHEYVWVLFFWVKLRNVGPQIVW